MVKEEVSTGSEGIKVFYHAIANLMEITNRVIRKGFPELLGEVIRIEFRNLRDALLQYGELTREGFYIHVDEIPRKAHINPRNDP